MNRFNNLKKRFSQKLFEISLNKNKFDSIQKGILPKKVLFNTTNVCNANCVFCAYSLKTDPVMTMSNDLFALFCKQYSELNPNSWLCLSPTVGEPFNDIKVFEKIEIASRYNMDKIEIYSNAILLKKYKTQIIDSKINILQISFPDFNEEEYRLIFRTTKYKTSLEGIYELLKIHKDTNSPMLICINLRSRRNIKNIILEKDFIDYVKPFLSEKVSFSHITNFDNWAGLIKEGDLPEGMTLKKDLKQNVDTPCVRLFKMMFLSNGDVKLCGCRFKGSVNDDLIIGNIYNETLKNIWFSKKCFNIREKWFLQKKLPETCIECSLYKPMLGSYFNDKTNFIIE